MPAMSASLQERPGVSRTVSRLDLFITGSDSYAAKSHDTQMSALPAEPEVTFAEVALPASPKQMPDSAIDFCPDAVIRIRTLTIEVR